MVFCGMEFSSMTERFGYLGGFFLLLFMILVGEKFRCLGRKEIFLFVKIDRNLFFKLNLVSYEREIH